MRALAVVFVVMVAVRWYQVREPLMVVAELVVGVAIGAVMLGALVLLDYLLRLPG